MGSVTDAEVDVKLVDERDATMEVGAVVIAFMFVLDPVRKSPCWLFDITVDLSGASTYRFCTRSGLGLGEIRLMLTGVLAKPVKEP